MLFIINVVDINTPALLRVKEIHIRISLKYLEKKQILNIIETLVKRPIVSIVLVRKNKQLLTEIYSNYNALTQKEIPYPSPLYIKVPPSSDEGTFS